MLVAVESRRKDCTQDLLRISHNLECNILVSRDICICTSYWWSSSVHTDMHGKKCLGKYEN